MSPRSLWLTAAVMAVALVMAWPVAEAPQTSAAPAASAARISVPVPAAARPASTGSAAAGSDGRRPADRFDLLPTRYEWHGQSVSGTAHQPRTVQTSRVTRWHVPVLMYHRIAPNSDLRGSIRDLVVRPSVFNAEMKKLANNGWHTITARQLTAAMKHHVPVPHRTFVLSFDDGTQDVYRNAWPIMQKYGFVGTFYLITQRIHNADRPHFYYMSQSQARALHAGGNEIGDHSRDHTCMSSGTSYATDYYEINRAARDIKSFIGVRPVTLAWPKGCYNSTAIRAARDARIYLALTTAFGASETNANRLTAPRIRVSRSDDARSLYNKVYRYR
jgi:peptidoglycan/xylan/chitin deacetylase (PgdA/CDA1 family)